MSKAGKVVLFFRIAIGFCLRLYRIGARPFWVGELGVTLAAMMPKLADALNFAYRHVMAMPLSGPGCPRAAWDLHPESHNILLVQRDGTVLATAKVMKDSSIKKSA